MPFYPPPPVPTPHMDPENQNFGKMKKTPEDNIILHTEMTVIMMYPSWDMECNRHNFLPFWTPFFALLPPFPSPMDPENQNFHKNEKTSEDIIILQT